MSAVTTGPATAARARRAAPAAAPSGPMWVVRDIGVVTWRNLMKVRRSPQLLLFSTVQPIMFVLLFNYVFGGALQIQGFDNYINFLLPGIFVQTAMFGSTQSGIALNEDLRAGIIDRFRSLPMARSAVLAGRTLADAARNTFVVLLMVAVGYVLGFRFEAGFLPAVGAVVLGVSTAFTFSWVSANIGMRAPDAETAQAGGFIWVFPLVFASSAFVSTESMPGWLRAWADNSPVTAIVDAIRVLVNGGATTGPVLTAAAWLLGILALAVPLAIRRYRRIT